MRVKRSQTRADSAAIVGQESVAGSSSADDLQLAQSSLAVLAEAAVFSMRRQGLLLGDVGGRTTPQTAGSEVVGSTSTAETDEQDSQVEKSTTTHATPAVDITTKNDELVIPRSNIDETLSKSEQTSKDASKDASDSPTNPSNVSKSSFSKSNSKKPASKSRAQKTTATEKQAKKADDQTTTERKQSNKSPSRKGAKLNEAKLPVASNIREDRLSKELKNLDIQITGYNSCINSDAGSSSGDMAIKASISEIVKTKSRTSAHQSMYGKGGIVVSNSEKLPAKPTETADHHVDGKSDDDKDGKLEDPKPSTANTKKPANRKPVSKKSKNVKSEQTMDSVGVSNMMKNCVKPKPTRKPKQSTKAQQNPTKTTKANTSTNMESTSDTIIPTDDGNSTQLKSVATSSSKPIAVPKKRAPRPRKTPSKPRPTKNSKPKSRQGKQQTNPMPNTISQITMDKETPPMNLTAILPAFMLSPKDNFSYAHSPNFSDPDTVASPMVLDTVDSALGSNSENTKQKPAGTGESQMRKIVQDILENLEMSDECSMAKEKLIEGKEPETSPLNIDIKHFKVNTDKITVKSIESLTLPESSSTLIIPPIEIKKEFENDDEHLEKNIKSEPTELLSHVNNDDIIFNEGKLIQLEPQFISSEQKSASDEIDTSTKDKDTADISESKDKDIYDFNESGHSSEDTSMSYIKNNKKDETTKTDKAIAPKVTTSKTSTPKKTVLPKKNASSNKKATPNTESSSAGSSDERVRSPRIRKSKRSTSTSSDSDLPDRKSDVSGSDTSVRTRVNNRRKSASKKRHIVLPGGLIEGPAKRHRMASLNALAKVQCLYENESRTAQELGFVREPRVAPRVRCVTTNPEAGPSGVATKKEAAGKAGSSAAAQKPDTVELKNDSKSDDVTPKVQSPKKQADKTKNESLAKDGAKAMEKNKESKADDSTDSSSEEESKPEIKIDIDAPRSMRTAPGLRGAGKLWEMGNMSSLESDTISEDDDSYEEVSKRTCSIDFHDLIIQTLYSNSQPKPDKSKTKKKPQPRKPAAKSTAKTVAVGSANKADSKPKAKPKTNKRTVSSARSSSSSDSSSDDDEADKTDKSKGSDGASAAAGKSKAKAAANKRQKRSPESQTVFKELVVRKRMASLNATAMLAASYEVERHMDMASLYNGSSTEDSDVDDPPSPRKVVVAVPDAVKAEQIDDATKEVFSVTFVNTQHTHNTKHFASNCPADSTSLQKRRHRAGHRRHHYRCVRQFSARLLPGGLVPDAVSRPVQRHRRATRVARGQQQQQQQRRWAIFIGAADRHRCWWCGHATQVVHAAQCSVVHAATWFGGLGDTG